MITEPDWQLIEHISHVFVAAADESGQPHMAIGEQGAVSGDSLLILENRFCPSTLENMTCNRHVRLLLSRRRYKTIRSNRSIERIPIHSDRRYHNDLCRPGLFRFTYHEGLQ
jgi:hypothetical protein